MFLFEPSCWAYAGLAALAILALAASLRVGQRPKDYPPGPPTIPILGNLHQIPSEKRHLQFEKWAQEYGPIYSLILGTKTMIVLNSDAAIRDLIDKKGAIYSSRPEAYIAQDVLSGGLRILFMPNDGAWTLARKMAHRILGVSAARTYVPYQDLENKAMLLGFLESPSEFISHLRRYTASLTTQMTFGFRTTTMHDKRFKEAFEIFDRSSELIGSRTATLLDLIPLLRNLPEFMLPIKKEGRELHRRELQLFRDLYLKTKEDLKRGKAKPCVCVDLVEMQKSVRFSDNLAAYFGGSLLQAGSETTASILVGFIQAMVIHPEVASAAQAELDSVCGDRMPDLNDVPNLPYIRACAKESMRWMPGFMLGIPHAIIQDDSYMGYRIPKGSIVIMNVWHPDPRRFDPLRYIDDHQTSIDAANNPDATKRDHFVFGAGRRRCQGMHIADRSVFLAISRLLWAFDFNRALDHEGNEIIPDMNDMADGIMMLPKPFSADIRPRNGTKAESIKQEWGQMLQMLDEDQQWKKVPDGLIWKDEHLSEISADARNE
ncbi:hypothetical protein S40285_06288 [Stachybotrys chlorohalonatus IBT 40285]|uniref:Cytochrome P450 n=1 Tax=Stachybotrys chlorohalonatus (strain IBT 40285) TaxID=1283841 RepID=A0A084QTD1_STAC4|nr:hypothetical protein S40285_06288 [Stachybotrys chlorohalonata IBT 40285]